MLNDARIRLEGRLERLERATFAAEAALAAARRGHWTLVLRGLSETCTREVSTAAEAAERLATLEPALGRPLRRLQRARIRLEDFVRARALERGIPLASVRTQVELLREERVFFDARVRSPWTIAFILLGILSFAAATHASRPLSLRLALIGVMSLTALLTSGVRVRLTQHALVVRKRLVPMADIVRVWFRTDTFDHWSVRHFVEIELRGSMLRTKLPSAPERLVAALEAAGVEVVRRNQGWL